MFSADTLRHLARRLAHTADRVTTVTERAARHGRDVEWDCPRGRRALRRAGELAVVARADADHLRTAAHHLERVADDLGDTPTLL